MLTPEEEAERRNDVSFLILDALAVLGALALQKRDGARLSSSEVQQMHDELFGILEMLNNYKEARL